MKFPTRKEKRDPEFMIVFNEELTKHANAKRAYKEARKRLGLVGNEKADYEE